MGRGMETVGSTIPWARVPAEKKGECELGVDSHLCLLPDSRHTVERRSTLPAQHSFTGMVDRPLKLPPRKVGDPQTVTRIKVPKVFCHACCHSNGKSKHRWREPVPYGCLRLSHLYIRTQPQLTQESFVLVFNSPSFTSSLSLSI